MSIEKFDTTSADSLWGSTDQFKLESLCVKVPYTSGVSGELYFVFSHNDTAKLADLMMMGDGTAGYEEDHKDALAELINQVMGAVSTAMGTEYGVSISTDQVSVESYDEGNIPFDTDSGVQANVNMKIEDFEDSEILLIAGKELADSFSGNYSDLGGAGDTSSAAVEVANTDRTGNRL